MYFKSLFTLLLITTRSISEQPILKIDKDEQIKLVKQITINLNQPTSIQRWKSKGHSNDTIDTNNTLRITSFMNRPTEKPGNLLRNSKRTNRHITESVAAIK